MDTDQQDRFRKAVDRKSEEAEAASRQQQHHAPAGAEPGIQGDQQNLIAPGEEQDTLSVRDKNSGHGHKTADKWNQ